MRDPVRWLPLAVILAASLAPAYLLRAFIVDDVFITMRFAEHWAGGHGIVWNVGEKPIEGTTTFLSLALFAAGMKLGIAPAAAAKGLSLAASLATISVIYAAALRFHGARVALLSAAFFAAWPATFIHASSGMDTALFGFLVAALMAAGFLHTVAPSAAGRWVLAALGTLAALARPEGAALAAIVLAVLALHDGSARAWAAPAGLAFAAPLALFAVWKLAYFGSLLPNTFYVKGSAGHLALKPLGAFLGDPFVLLGSLFVLAGLFRRAFPEDWLVWRNALTFIPAGLLLLYYAQARLLMNYQHRFFYPCFAALVLAAMPSIEFAIDRLRKSLRPALAASGLMFLLIWYPLAASAFDFAREYSGAMRDFKIIGEAIARAAGAPGAISVVSTDAGAIPFYSKQRAIDPIGLTDAHIARDGADAVGYIYAQSPDALALTGYSPAGADQEHARALAADPRFAEYDLVARFDSAPRYFKFIYARREGAKFSQLKSEFEKVAGPGRASGE